MKKVFLDCGSHLGEGFAEFISILNIDPTWTCHLFEPNLSCYNRIKSLATNWITIHQNAVWDRETTIRFRAELSGVTGINDGLCSTILDETHYPFRQNHRQETYDVQSISLPKFIQDNTAQDDEIYIKLDIEGSEFDVVQGLLASDVMPRIKYMAIEWHSWAIVENKQHYEKLEQELKQSLKQQNLTLIDWK